MSRIVVMIGQPGAGKGTQARLLSDKCNYPQISTGDLLRNIVSSDSPMAHELRETMNSGRLVDDGILASLLSERTSQADCQGGYILDGYPRNLHQAQTLEDLAASQAKSVVLISFSLDEDVLLKRITGRRTCTRCGEIYNIFSRPPAVEGYCDIDGAPLARRGDDSETVVRERLAAYRNSTAPLIAYYRDTSRLIEVDAGQPVDQVQKRIIEILGSLPGQSA